MNLELETKRSFSVIDLQKSIRIYMKEEEGRLPWSYGARDSRAWSSRIALIWDLLPVEERLIISKWSPFRAPREKHLCILNELGMPLRSLVIVSGLSLGTVHDAVRRARAGENDLGVSKMERLRNWIRRYVREHNGGNPWPMAVEDPDRLSSRARRVWAVLPVEDRLILSAKSPFKQARIDLLRELRALKTSQSVLSEVSGLAKSTIGRVFLFLKDAE